MNVINETDLLMVQTTVLAVAINYAINQWYYNNQGNISRQNKAINNTFSFFFAYFSDITQLKRPRASFRRSFVF